jgi:hypothetical protein
VVLEQNLKWCLVLDEYVKSGSCNCIWIVGFNKYRSRMLNVSIFYDGYSNVGF